LIPPDPIFNEFVMKFEEECLVEEEKQSAINPCSQLPHNSSSFREPVAGRRIQSTLETDQHGILPYDPKPSRIDPGAATTMECNEKPSWGARAAVFQVFLCGE
jgi:hypothetical protein